MQFSGRLYYDFVSPDVFRFFQVLAAAEREGIELGLDWRPLPGGDGAPDGAVLAAAELIRVEAPQRHGAFLQAVLVVVHLEGGDVTDPALPSLAARVAGLDPGVVSAERIAGEGASLVDRSAAEAAALGVAGVPTIYRHGPPVKVVTTPAITTGRATHRLELISAMLEDDGVWELSKP